MDLYLYGVIEGDRPMDFGSIGFDGKNVTAIPGNGLGAVVGNSPQKGIDHLQKEELVSLLLAHQQTLESVMKRFFVLPFKFGTILGDRSELDRILEGSGPLLKRLVAQMKDSVEMDLIVTWDVRTMLQEISEEDPEIAACKQQMVQNRADPFHIGKLLAEALKRRADAWVRKITQLLGGAVVDSANHDLQNDGMIFNTSFLVRRDLQKGFFHILEEVDRVFEGKLHFKCVGPLPPYSFATVTLKRFDPAQIREAATLLHLEGKVEISRLKKIYRELSRTVHPDHHVGVSAEQFERLSEAYELVADYCREGARSLGEEAVVQYIRLDSLTLQGETR
ncbi:MAG: GvpL/GvpF family gas vesicle protein [Deltaproteobacteria bacterium]|nr:GvpL/GvpF family gas vesicle protein [Deltaproteobacteria bacterium]